MSEKSERKRKLIGFITSKPDEEFPQRLMSGLFRQCALYDYDVAVFSPLVQVCHYYKTYLKGELNIYRLINYDLLDGIIIDSISLSQDKITWINEAFNERLKKEGFKNAVMIDLPVGDFHCEKTDDAASFRNITSHLVDVHGCRDFIVLTGMKGYDVSEKRLDGVKAELSARGIDLPEENVIWGDFWYSSGDALGRELAAGKRPMPDAVICTSDHMAIGLVNRLIKLGFRVPEDVIVTGFDATPESGFNELSVTTYVPDSALTAARAVNCIREMIEPGAELLPPVGDGNGMVLCESCGCTEKLNDLRQRLKSAMLIRNINYEDDDILDNVNMARIIDSYMLETLTNTGDVENCLGSIFNYDYLLRPYGDFYLCLRPDWIDTDSYLKEGYPEKMSLIMHTIPWDGTDESVAHRHLRTDGKDQFETSLMLPALWEEHEPSVFYFFPTHFEDNTFGYGVLRCDITQEKLISEVVNYWMRSVNNALELTRTQNTLRLYSEHDQMTGLLNRRAMERWLEEQRDKYGYVIVVDMDGLKGINDTFGHEEGDFSIKLTAEAVSSIAGDDDICVRAGGDEFFIMGTGEYSEEILKEKERSFYQTLEKLDRQSGRPYHVSASFGAAAGKDLRDATARADKNMYRCKLGRKSRRDDPGGII